jgi:hypothetical protein
MNIMRACLPLALAAASGCAGTSMHSVYSEPYATFVSERRMSMQGVVPATLRRIDGKPVDDARRGDPVKPGPHSIEVSIVGLPEGHLKTLSVDAKPCMRYFLGAKPDSAGQLTPYVTDSEPIKECRS